jgi:glycosyltransferase involved in cell wall biosynthesis
MKKISIAIPTWETNGKGVEFLDDLLRTIEIQNFKYFEVVISDHSQNNDILNKCQEFNSKFDIKYFKNENNRGNGPANTNNAISKCSGEIIKIMFQDDFFYDDEALEKIYYALHDSDKMWLLNGTNHTKDDGNTFSMIETNKQKGKFYLKPNHLDSIIVYVGDINDNYTYVMMYVKTGEPELNSEKEKYFQSIQSKPLWKPNVKNKFSFPGFNHGFMHMMAIHAFTTIFW